MRNLTDSSLSPNLERPQRPSKHRWYGLAGLFALAALPSLYLGWNSQIALEFDERLSLIASSLLSLILITSPYPRFPRATVLLLAPVALLALIELQFAVSYGWAIDANTLSLIPETNPAEAADFLSSISLRPLIGIALTLFATYLAWPRIGQSIPYWSIKRLAAYSGVSLLITLSSAYVSGSAMQIDIGQENVFRPPPHGQALAIRGSYPSGIPFVVADFLAERRALKEAYTRNQNFRFGVSATANSAPGRRVFVMVIGETSRADRWQINGYERNTTPHLIRRDGVISLKNMFSPSSFSRLAVPLLITRKPPTSSSALFDEASIVTAFKEAGYSTTWISLQAPVGFHESPISVHAYEADVIRFLNPGDYRTHGKFDTAAIPELQKILEDASLGDSFIVIHTLGSHFRYTDRYPSESALFLPDRYTDRQVRLLEQGDREVLSNSYDNSIAFTDFFLDSLIGALQDKDNLESWLFYASDHGEALFDDCRMLSGHGLLTRETQHVAALFWGSNKFRDGHSNLIKSLEENSNKITSTSMVFETLASLGDLVVPQARPNNNLAELPIRHPEEVARAQTTDDFQCTRTGFFAPIQGQSADLDPRHH